MKKLLILVTTIVLLAINGYAQEVQNVDVSEFAKYTEELDKNEVLLDVRSKGEIKEGYIKGMTHINFHSEDFDQQVKELDKAKTYYVYCAAGGRSYQAANKLIEAGIKNVYNLNGGIIAWNKEGKSIEK